MNIDYEVMKSTKQNTLESTCPFHAMNATPQRSIFYSTDKDIVDLFE